MGKVKAWLENEAEIFLAGVEEEVKSGKISVSNNTNVKIAHSFPHILKIMKTLKNICYVAISCIV